jgi:hypothetical protein
MIRFFRFYLLLFVLISGEALGASLLTAHVDKTKIAEGETFTLTLEYAGRATAEPDLSVLQKDFAVISRQVSTQSSFVNGDFRVQTSWILELQPKRAVREIVIPPISLGNSASSPIHIEQSEQRVATKDQNLSLSVTPNRTWTYPHGEIILTIEIKTPLLLRHGTISKPEIADAIVEIVVDDELTSVVEEGIKYHVFRQSYAIFPSKKGNLTIPALVFNGVIAGGRNRANHMADFFGGGQKITARSSAITIDVRDIPNSFPKNQPFLPLENLVIIESFDQANPKFEVNKAVARRFEIKAKGLTSFLPEIAVPSVEKLQIYVENGNKEQKKVDGDIEASSKIAHVYMPTAPGVIHVPAQTIYWWDMSTDSLKTTQIRELDLDVGGVVASAPGEHVQKENLGGPQNHELENEKSLEQSDEFHVGMWQILTALFLFLWLATLIFFIARFRKKHIFEESPTNLKTKHAKELINNIISLCDKNDAKAVYAHLQSLASWLKQHEIHGEIDSIVRRSQRDLEDALFNKKTSQDISHVLSDVKKIKEMKLNSQKEQVFPPLYPQ